MTIKVLTFSSMRAALCAVLIAMLAACGSKAATDPTAGSPTGGNGGTSGSEGLSRCTEGDTRTCVGPGACKGGQACGAEGKWTPCDCGDSAGLGGSMTGTGTAGMTSLLAGAGGTFSEVAGAGAAAGNSGFGGTEGEAGAGGTSSVDPKCPDDTVALDCSGQCGGSAKDCDVPCGDDIHVDKVSIGSTLVRLPSHPGHRCTCVVEGTPPAAFSFVVVVDHLPAGPMHVLLPAPWSVAVYPPASCALPFIAPCLNFSAGDGVAITTSDPEAPTGNVVVEAGRCPPSQVE